MKILIKMLFQVIFLLIAFNQFTYAQQSKLDSLNKILVSSHEDTSRVTTLNEIIKIWIKSSPDTAMKFAFQVLHLSEKLGWRKGLWIGYHQIGSCYHYKSEYSNALSNYEKAISICDLHESEIMLDNARAAREVWKAGTLNNIGLIYTSLGDYPKALEYHLQSLSLKEKNGEPVVKDNINIANVYNYISDFTKAIKHYQTALQMASDANDNDNKLIALSNLGSVYYKQMNYSKALNLYFQSLALAEQSGNKNLILERLGNIGLVYGDQKDYVKSFDYLSRAIKMAEESGNISNQIAFVGSLGSYYTQKGEYESAENYLKMALEKAKKIRQLDYIFQIENYLTELYKKSGKYKEALIHQDSAIVLKDSLFNLEKDNEIKNKMLGYEFEKNKAIIKAESDAEIEKQKTLRKNMTLAGGVLLVAILIFIFLYKLKRDADQQAKDTATKLKISETELKALRLQINPHFINNAMQSVQSFMRNHQPVEAEEYLIMFSNLTRAILENSEYEEISIRREKEILEWYMNLENARMTYPFTYKFNIDPSIDIDTVNVPPNILQPFVENSIIHGLKDKQSSGNITISINKENEDLHIIIEDDGVGRTTTKSVQQPMILKKKSMGMKITQERLNILNNKKNRNASFKISDLILNSPTSGTRVELNLPI